MKDKLTIEVPKDTLLGKYIPSIIYATPPDSIGIYGGTHPTFKQRKIVHKNEGVISLRWDPEQWLSVIVRVEGPRNELGWKSESDDESGLFYPVVTNGGSRDINQNTSINPVNRGFDKTSRRNNYEAATMLARANAEQVEYVRSPH